MKVTERELKYKERKKQKKNCDTPEDIYCENTEEQRCKVEEQNFEGM